LRSCHWSRTQGADYPSRRGSLDRRACLCIADSRLAKDAR
jgi:hypothetical protein